MKTSTMIIWYLPGKIPIFFLFSEVSFWAMKFRSFLLLIRIFLLYLQLNWVEINNQEQIIPILFSFQFDYTLKKTHTSSDRHNCTIILAINKDESTGSDKKTNSSIQRRIISIYVDMGHYFHMYNSQTVLIISSFVYHNMLPVLNEYQRKSSK